MKKSNVQMPLVSLKTASFYTKLTRDPFDLSSSQSKIEILYKLLFFTHLLRVLFQYVYDNT